MVKNEHTCNRRMRDLYDKVSIAIKNGEKILGVIMDFAKEHYLSEPTVWRIYHQGVKEFGEIPKLE